MGCFELQFLPKDKLEEPTDEQLFFQLIYGLCGSLENNPLEENSRFFVSSVGIPLPDIRRLAKLLVSCFGSWIKDSFTTC